MLLKSNSKYFINFLISLVIFVILFTIYTPIFETNDDVAMSMIAHGYGMSLKPSPYIMFSNVIYGYIIYSLPTINGIFPYSYMTFFALFLVTYILLCCLDEFTNLNKLIAIALITAIMIRPIAMPQFTVNAGLLAICSLISLIVYFNTKKNIYLVFWFFIAFYSYLIRYQELLFIYLVGAPFLLDKRVFDKKLIFLFLMLIVFFVFAEYINIRAYQGESFSNYNALAKVRIPFNDFGAGLYFINHLNILHKYGYSINDMFLLSKFIFADTYLADPKRMAALLVNLPSTRYYSNIPLVFHAVISIFDESFYPLLLLAILGFVYTKSKIKLINAWIIYILLIGLIGLLGRPSVLRIYYPILALLSFIPFLYITQISKFKYLILLLIITSNIYIGLENYKLNVARVHRAELAYQDFAHIKNSSEIYYLEGGSLPYEYIFLPLRPFDSSVRLYAFGSAYFLPSTVSNEFVFSDKSFSSAFKNSSNINIIAEPIRASATETYCSEHYNKKLKYLSVYKLDTFSIYNIVCK